MRFGIHFELSVGRPWSPDSERRVYFDTLEHVRLADQLGFDQAWAVEHHFLEEHSHCSAPEVFLAACAMVTEHIRLGHGIVTCVPQINHPVRVAERVAALDILSGGRVEVGTGRSSTWTELGGFGVDPDDTKRAWDEYVRVLPKMWTQDRVSWDGVTFRMPERNVVPKPLQKPHPPMWVAVISPGTELDAADRGLGSLGLAFGSVESNAAQIAGYRRRIQHCDPVGEFVNEQVATVNFLHCHEDDRLARRRGRRLLDEFQYYTSQFAWSKDVYPGPAYASSGLLAPLRRQAIALADAGADEETVPDGFCAGSPDRLIEVLRRWESVGVDHVNFLLNVGDILTQDEVLESMRLFAAEVMPAFGVRPPLRGTAGEEVA